MKSPILYSPQMGMGSSLAVFTDNQAVVVEDYMFESSVAGELTLETSPSDFHDTWDLDGTDFMPEASPDDEGYWDDFENIVLNSNYEELGSEQVSYPSDVSSVTDPWVLDSSTNKYKYIDSGSGTGRLNFGTSFAVEVGQIYKVEIDITISSGNANLQFASGNSQTKLFSYRDLVNGLNTFFTTVTGVNGSVNRIFASENNTDNDFTLNSVSVKQVDPNSRWSLGTGWTISDGKAHADVSSTAALSQTLSTGAGNTYEITVTISNLTAGMLQPQFGGILSSPAQITSNGTHTVFITATGSSSGLLLYALNTSAFSIDNITIKEYAITPLDV